ncbi:hypothetical protein NAEGRDRAFT_80072 [Naegleria gruberi]|uniref:Uncharacterized protein n=1 Tax=Naegleria gruberi TaxID=5762 RepID=D2VIC5_NAEGR|nr:uncharacterized protein NAEGRDRAFT_80072 [Naegleria gruberi]EFC43485.1 hypothetical protein NAEGRDRAFT_80072 [Naegleria gruberi]|eukprot:XP_002676229.1 hypothetical protein NAEGRDRAFT_80072 [Naegleria gruberi strain NEG-M]
MKNSVLSLFKKKTNNNNNESDDSNTTPSSPHSGSFSNLSDLLQSGSLVYNSLPETTLSYGHIQTPFNVFELNRRMYQTNSQVLLQKQNNSSSPATPNGSNNNRLSLSQQQTSSQPIALTPSLLMGKRKELNRISTQSPTADITPRSSSPSITTTTTTTNITTTNTSNGTNANTSTNNSSATTPSTPIATTTSNESTATTTITPTIKTSDNVVTTATATAVSSIVKTALSDQEKLIGIISSYLVPHKDHLKSRECLTSQNLMSVLVLNKKWNSILMANDLSTINDDVVKLWAILVEEMYEPAANIENDHMSKKFIELCMFFIYLFDLLTIDSLNTTLQFLLTQYLQKY